MKSCLACLVLLIAVFSIVLTVAYHASVNSELRFEPKDSHEEYINTRRSFRPRKPQRRDVPAPAVNLPEDDVAEEVEP